MQRMRNDLLIDVAIVSPTTKNEAEVRSAMGIGKAPLATGRNFLNGCLRSFGASRISLIIYPDDDKKQNAINAQTVV